MTPDDKDFLLALYGKLWDNINNKDSRLWTFLSIYAAAVGVVFAVGQAVSIGLYAAVVIQVLTLWALFITLNATWWDQRNRLIVEKIEVKFASAVKGVIPEIYRAETPRLDWLNQVSVIMIVLVASVIFLKSMWSFFDPNSIATLEILVVLSIQYLVAVLGGYFWLHQQEQFVQQYFDTVHEIHKDNPAPAPAPPPAYPAIDVISKARKDKNWRWKAVVLFVGATVFFDIVFANNAASGLWYMGIAAIVVQLVAVGAFVYQTRRYYSPKDQNDLPKNTLDFRNVWWVLCLVNLVLLLLASRIYLKGPLPTSGTAAPTITELKLEREKIIKLLQDLETKAVTVEDQQRREELKPYLREEDAKKQYLQRDDARKQFLPTEERDKFLTNQEAARRFPSRDEYETLRKQLQDMRQKEKSK